MKEIIEYEYDRIATNYDALSTSTFGMVFYCFCGTITLVAVDVYRMLLLWYHFVLRIGKRILGYAFKNVSHKREE